MDTREKRIFDLTKYLIEHPNDDNTIFHICDANSQNLAEAIERFKKLKNSLKNLKREIPID